MSRKSTHRITVCISCRHNGSTCRAGYELIKRLGEAIHVANTALGADFEISGVACMAGCDRPCTVAYHGSDKATHLFGDINPDDSIDDLVVFAKQYAELEDGWCASTQRSAGLSGKTLARVPAALIITQATAQPLN